MNMINNEIDKALHNCGYRFLAHEEACHCYGKPLGYGILRADVPDKGKSISVSLIVKGNKKDEEWPNLLYGAASRELPSASGEDLYNECVLLTKDCAAQLFLGTAIAIPINRRFRYDFIEGRMNTNPSFGVEGDKTM